MDRHKLVIAAIVVVGVILQWLPAVEAGARWMPCDPKCK